MQSQNNKDETITKVKERIKLALLGYNAGIYEWNMLDNSAYYSDEWKEMLGFDKDEQIAPHLSTWANLVHPDDFDEIMLNVEKVVKNLSKTVETVHRLKHTDGRWIWILGRGYIEYNADGTPVKMVGIHTDITQQKLKELKLIHQAQIIEQIHDSVISTDLEGNILTWNKGSELLFGYKKNEIITKHISIIEYEKNYTAYIEHVITNNTLYKEIRLKTKNNIIIFVDLHLSVLRDSNDNIMGIIGYLQDITKRVEAEKELRYRAYHDTLTNLPNRLLFKDRLNMGIKKAKRTNAKIGLFFIDLDHFKKINDTYGHDVGDEVLQEVANRIKKLIREEDTLSRIGGDEFIIIMENLKTIKDTSILAEKILATLSLPITINTLKIFLSTSIGISIYPDDAQVDSDLIKHADNAMYKAKSKGRDNFQYYNNTNEKG